MSKGQSDHVSVQGISIARCACHVMYVSTCVLSATHITNIFLDYRALRYKALPGALQQAESVVGTV